MVWVVYFFFSAIFLNIHHVLYLVQNIYTNFFSNVSIIFYFYSYSQILYSFETNFLCQANLGTFLRVGLLFIILCRVQGSYYILTIFLNMQLPRIILWCIIHLQILFVTLFPESLHVRVFVELLHFTRLISCQLRWKHDWSKGISSMVNLPVRNIGFPWRFQLKFSGND